MSAGLCWPSLGAASLSRRWACLCAQLVVLYNILVLHKFCIAHTLDAVQYISVVAWIKVCRRSTFMVNVHGQRSWSTCAHRVMRKYGSWSMAQGIRQRTSLRVPYRWGKESAKEGAACRGPT